MSESSDFLKLLKGTLRFWNHRKATLRVVYAGVIPTMTSWEYSLVERGNGNLTFNSSLLFDWWWISQWFFFITATLSILLFANSIPNACFRTKYLHKITPSLLCCHPHHLPQHQHRTSVRCMMASAALLSLHTSKNNDNYQSFVENKLMYRSSTRRLQNRGVVGGDLVIRLGLETVTEWEKELTW